MRNQSILGLGPGLNQFVTWNPISEPALLTRALNARSPRKHEIRVSSLQRRDAPARPGYRRRCVRPMLCVAEKLAGGSWLDPINVGRLRAPNLRPKRRVCASSASRACPYRMPAMCPKCAPRARAPRCRRAALLRNTSVYATLPNERSRGDIVSDSLGGAEICRHCPRLGRLRPQLGRVRSNLSAEAWRHTRGRDPGPHSANVLVEDVQICLALVLAQIWSCPGDFDRCGEVCMAPQRALGPRARLDPCAAPRGSARPRGACNAKCSSMAPLAASTTTPRPCFETATKAGAEARPQARCRGSKKAGQDTATSSMATAAGAYGAHGGGRRHRRGRRRGHRRRRRRRLCHHRRRRRHRHRHRRHGRRHCHRRHHRAPSSSPSSSPSLSSSSTTSSFLRSSPSSSLPPPARLPLARRCCAAGESCSRAARAPRERRSGAPPKPTRSAAQTLLESRSRH